MPTSVELDQRLSRPRFVPITRRHRNPWTALVTGLALLILSSCSSFHVASEPSGADILFDGVVSGFKTPAKLRAKNFPNGIHTISVSMPGYETITPATTINVSTSGGKIVLAILLPIPFLFIGIGSGFRTALAPKTMNFKLRSLHAQ